VSYPSFLNHYILPTVNNFSSANNRRYDG